jgi:hypothetical protein
MSSGAPAPSFLTYLTCELPHGYPFDPPLTPQSIPLLKERHRKMLVVQQAAFFETAQSLSATQPWLVYLAALKHDAILSFVPIETTPFVNVTDQKYFNTCQENWRSLRHEIRKAVDDGISFFCERLVSLQREAALIDEVEKNLGVAMTKGFTALLPITLEPPAGASPEMLKQWTHQDAYLQLCERPLNRITSLSPEMRQNGLRKLPDCVAALKGLHEERDILVATYITPYIS